MLLNSIVPFLFLAITMSIFCDGTEANPLCPRVKLSVEDCTYGTSRNWCLQEICRQGPDEPCGGPLERDGVCGRGMLCINDRCVGCSFDTLECSKTPIL